MTLTIPKAKAYLVYRFGMLIDTVWFTGYTADEVRDSLIQHDKYDYRIKVYEA